MKKINNSAGLLLSALLLVGIFFVCGCVDDPVGKEYYNDLDKIKGGQKPTPPVLDSLSLKPLTGDGYPVVVTFSSDGNDGPEGPDGAYDPDSGTNNNLSYFFYASTTDPASFSDASSYYDELYYIGYITDAEAGVDPKDVTIYIHSGFSGEIWFWITSWDGGRESDHSDVESVTIP